MFQLRLKDLYVPLEVQYKVEQVSTLAPSFDVKDTIPLRVGSNPTVTS